MTYPSSAPQPEPGWRPSEPVLAGHDGAGPAPWPPPVGGAERPVNGSGWEVPAPGYPAGPPVDAPSRGREWLLAGALAIVMVLLGFPLGWLWSTVAPWTPVQMTTDGAVLAQPEQEQMIADEGWYVFLTVGLGIVIVALAWGLLRRYRGVPMLLGLALGGVGTGVLTWWFGHNIGLAHFKYLLKHAPVNATFGMPVNLRVKQVGMWHGVLPYARGDVLLLAVTVTVIYLLLAGFSPHPSLRADGEPAPVAHFPYPGGFPQVGGLPQAGGLPGGGLPGGGQPQAGGPARQDGLPRADGLADEDGAAGPPPRGH